jgi:hypothetical protein
LACSSGLGVANLPHQIVQTAGACVRRTVPKHGDYVGGDDELAIRKSRSPPPIDGRWDQVVEAAAGTNGNLTAACQRNKAPASKGFGHLTAHHVYSIVIGKIKVIAENSEAAFSVLHDAAPAITTAITAASTVAATAAITTPTISAAAITATISTTIAPSVTAVATASITAASITALASITTSIASITGIAGIAGSIAAIHPAWLGICVGVGGSGIGVGLGRSIGSILSVGKTTEVSVTPTFA